MRIIFYLLILIGLASCNNDKDDHPSSETDQMTQSVKNNPDMAESIVNDLNSKTIGDWWRRTKIWMNDHYGSYLFNDCSGSGGCGPCIGICFRFGIISGNPTGPNENLPAADYNDGMRSFALSVIVNDVTSEETLMFETAYLDEFTLDDKLFVPDTVRVDHDITDRLGKNNILIFPGIYSVVFNGSNNLGAVILEVEMD